MDGAKIAIGHKEMNQHLEAYLDYCTYQKKLSPKTVKAYRIDLRQFSASIKDGGLSKVSISGYVVELHKQYKPRTVARKIASVRAFISFLDDEELIEHNPLLKMKLSFRTPAVLPRTIPKHDLKMILSEIYLLPATAIKSPHSMRR